MSGKTANCKLCFYLDRKEEVSQSSSLPSRASSLEKLSISSESIPVFYSPQLRVLFISNRGLLPSGKQTCHFFKSRGIWRGALLLPEIVIKQRLILLLNPKGFHLSDLEKCPKHRTSGCCQNLPYSQNVVILFWFASYFVCSFFFSQPE